MKKLFFVAAIACVALSFSSCKESNEARCWKVSFKKSGIESLHYVWMSEDAVNATYGKFESFKCEKVLGSEGDCLDLENEKGGTKIEF